MANNITNKITFYGNAAVIDEVERFENQFIARQLQENNSSDTHAVGIVLFDRSESDPPVSFEEVDAKWAFFDNLGIADTLAFISGNYPVTGLQDHLTNRLSALDPHVVTVMAWEEEGPTEVGARVSLVSDGELRSFESRYDLSDYEVVSENELGDESRDDVITWDQIWEIVDECKQDALSDAESAVDWIDVSQINI